jgi:hypothetical protein
MDHCSEFDYLHAVGHCGDFGYVLGHCGEFGYVLGHCGEFVYTLCASVPDEAVH